MNRQSLAPAELFSSTDFGFAQVVSVEGKRMVFCAGQTSGDKDNKLVGRDDLGQRGCNPVTPQLRKSVNP